MSSFDFFIRDANLTLQRFPHTPEQTCTGYLKRILSYCDTDDEFCDGKILL